MGYTLDSKDIEHQENTKFELDSWYYKRLKFLLFWGMFIEGDILKRTTVMRVYIVTAQPEKKKKEKKRKRESDF